MKSVPSFSLVVDDEGVLLDGKEARTFSPYTDEDPGDLIALWIAWFFDNYTSKASMDRAFTSEAFLDERRWEQAWFSTSHLRDGNRD